ncbi:MAG: hypothetical protein J6N15_12075 [Ruminiclostridium sp.]|nr:hypothetical protein [Ruminiclostridium sp.]
MTVEELNIKISADAESFKKELAAAKNAIDAFRNDAVSAGNAVTAAFDGLITADVTAAEVSGSTVNTEGYTETLTPRGIPSSVPASAVSGRRVGGIAAVPELGINETVIGAVSGGGESSPQPVNITTTVELDGDKVGQSVERYNLRRNRMTNGMYQ